MNYFVKVSANWADEMDVYGCCIISNEEFEKVKAEVERYFKKQDELTVGIGSNEELTFDSADEVMSCYEVKEISDEEERVLTSLGLDNFGELIVFSPYFDFDYDDDEDEEEDMEDYAFSDYDCECGLFGDE